MSTQQQEDRWVPHYAQHYCHPLYTYGEWVIEKDINSDTWADRTVITQGVYFKTEEECQEWIKTKAPKVEL